MSIDLHLHSHYSSNGEYSVLDLFKKAEEAGLTVAAIADEDSVQANKEVLQYENFSKTKWISAMQISVNHSGVEFQIIGYGINSTYPWFEKHEQLMKQSYLESVPKTIDRLNELYQFNLKLDDLKTFAKEESITALLIARYILSLKELETHPEIKKFKSSASRFYSLENSFVRKYLSLGTKAYIQNYSANYYDALDAIHRSGGVAVLAHPGLNIKEDNGLLAQLVHLGLDGIECYSPYHSEIQNAFYVSFAMKRGLLITCGSDFGRKNEKTKVGQTHCPLNAKEIVELFAKRGILI